MKLKELLPIIDDDCVINVYDHQNKRVYFDTKFNFKPYTIETSKRDKFIDDINVDIITANDDLDMSIFLY